VAPLSGRVQIRSASLERVLSDGKISWVLGAQGLRKPPPPTTNAKQHVLVKLKHNKTTRRTATSPRDAENPLASLSRFHYWTGQWACWPHIIIVLHPCFLDGCAEVTKRAGRRRSPDASHTHTHTHTHTHMHMWCQEQKQRRACHRGGAHTHFLTHTNKYAHRYIRSA